MMVNWQTKKLGDIGRIAMCKRIMKDQTSAHGDIPFYKIGTFGKNPDAYISSELYENYKSKYSFPKIGEILISASGTIGRAVVYDGSPAYFQDSNIVWLAHDESVVLNKFLGYAYTRVNWQTDSGTIARLYNDNFRRVTIKVPEKPEQERIVGVLEVWDEYIEKLEQKIALKEQLKKGLMQQLLTGKRRLPGFGKEWRDFKMNELGNTYSGLAGKTKDDFGSGEPFITYMNIYSNPVLNTKNMQLVRIGENERQSIAEYGDIFFTTSSETPDEVGISSVLLDKSDQNIYLNSFCFGFRMNNRSTLDPRFAAYYFRSSVFRRKMTRIAQGASRYNLSKKYFMETEIRVPELDEQLAIAVLLENIDKQIAVHSAQYKNLKIQKKYLLKNLITGAIRTPEDLQPLDASRLERSAL